MSPKEASLILIRGKMVSVLFVLSLTCGSVGCDSDPTQLMTSVGATVSDRSEEEPDINVMSQEIPDEDKVAEPAMISGSHLTTVVCEPESDASILCRYSNENAKKLISDYNQTVKVIFRDKDGNTIDEDLLTVEDQPEDSPWSVRIKINESVEITSEDWSLSFSQPVAAKAEESSPSEEEVPEIETVSKQELFTPEPPLAEVLDVDLSLVDYEKDSDKGGTSFILKFSLTQMSSTKIFLQSCQDLAPWLPYSSAEPLDYSKISGRVFLKFKDAEGRVSDCLEKSITLDFDAPDDVQGLSVSSEFLGNSGKISALWEPASDSGSGVSEYQVSVGLSAGTQDISGWTNTGGETTWSAENLPADLGRDYFLNVRAVDREGNISGVVSSQFQYSFTLADEFGSSLMLWLDAMDVGNSTPSDGEEISAWLDKSGNDYHFTNTTSASPVWVEDAIGGNPGLRFGTEGTPDPSRMLRNDTIEIRQGFVPDLTSISVYVKKRNAYPHLWVGTGNTFSKRTNSTADAPIGVPVISMHQYQYDSTVAGSTWLQAVLNKTNITRDGAVNYETDANSNTGMAMGCLLYSWKDYPGTYFGDYYAGEVILINRVLTSLEKEKIWNYLSQKWGISISQ